MKDQEIVVVDGIEYRYNEFHQRLTAVNTCETDIHVRCPICLNDTFTLKYGKWGIIAVCNCGHEMTVYDG